MKCVILFYIIDQGEMDMGMFLNSIVPYEEYKEIAGARFFVDKSSLIDEIISNVRMDGQRYF